MAHRDRQEARYAWRRHWISPDDLGGVAVRGLFSVALHAMNVGGEQRKARTLREMHDVRILLLRGESGAGKTVALEQEAERLRGAGRPVEMADLTDGLCDLSSLLEEKGGRQDLTIFVDGLDVGLIRDKALDADLRRAAPMLARAPGARLRLALRTGFAAGSLAACFAQQFGDEFEHLTIAPLRPEDVRTAAMAEGIDPDAFLAALEGLRVAPLAARPPTLRMLLRLWAEAGSLPKRRQDLYRRGCTLLLREANPARFNAGGGDDPDYSGRLDHSERFAIAARLAALMTFGDYDRLDLGAEPTRLELHVDDVTGGVERTSGGSLRVTRTAVREVVGSALFRPAGTNGFAFSHPSFMRFLAAVYVADRRRPPPQVLPLFAASDGRIGANRIEAASWLGALDPAYFDHLADADPQVLLRAGIPASRGEQRLRLAKSLLALGADGGLDLRELSATGDLVLVASPGLDQLLAEVLNNKGEPASRRAFAAKVARETGCVPVAACAAVALDDNESSDLRCAALAALGQDAKSVEAEAAILALSAANAPDDGLHPVALLLAMQTLLSPADVIRRLKPCDRSAVQSALCLHLLGKITVGSLPEALEAMADVAVRSSRRREYWNHLIVAQGLASRAFAHLHVVRVRDAFATFIAALPPSEPWLRWSYPLNKSGLPGAATLECRRTLVSAVVARAPGSVAAARNLLEGCFLLHNEDLSWIVEEARSSLGGPNESVWSTLAVEVILGFGGVPFDHLRAEGATVAEIGRLGKASFRFPGDYERWTPPQWLDISTGKNPPEHEAETGGDEVDEEEVEEPILTALADWQLLTIQTEAGGRPNAPSVSPGTVLALADQADRRLVRDGRDLLRVVHESLSRLQTRLKGRDPLVRALWDEGRSPRPKEENFFSDFIVDHLRRDLVDRSVVADREVQIRPRVQETAGQRTDIRIQAFTSPEMDGPRELVAGLTIEVKGCWNKELHHGMRTQLADRYLVSAKESVGLYVVGWYVCPAWSKRKIAGVAAGKVTFEALRAILDEQARTLSDDSRHIESILIDATLS